MNIKVDFEIGDTVWFMGNGTKIRALSVQKIEIAVREAGKEPNITLTPFNWVAIDIKRCFHTKMELIAYHVAIWNKATGKEC